MTALTWLLQENLRDRRFLDEAKRVLDQLGLAWCAVSVVPFSTEVPALPSEVEAGAIVCYGPSFVPRVFGATWRPGIFFHPDTFRWSAMRAHWQDLMFSEDGEPSTLGDVLDELEMSGQSVFVRPDADNKRFDGAVYDADGLHAATETMDRNGAVISATPRVIDAEWRCFVVGGEVVSGSEYRRGGRQSLQTGVPPHVVEVAEEAAARWVPASVICIDVAAGAGRLGIVEANCFNASHFYAADTALVFSRVTAHCRAAGGVL